MVHETDPMQPLRWESETYAENVRQLLNADDDRSNQEFEWVQEERNFINENNPCKEFFVKLSPMNRAQRYD
jgi:hypothetical protein